MLVIVGAESLGIEIVNTVAIMGESNTEVGMQLSSDMKNMDRIFYSDMNGFTLHKVCYLAVLYQCLCSLAYTKCAI